MNKATKRTLIIAGAAAVGLLAFAGTAGAAEVKQPEEGEDGGDTEGEGETPIEELPKPLPPAASNPGIIDPPNTGNEAMLNGFFGNSAGIARALYLLGFGNTSAQMASEMQAEFADADDDDDLAFVREFQRAYNNLSAKGGTDTGVAFGAIPTDLGSLATDGTMGYRTLAALYNTLRFFSPGAVWNLTTSRVKGSASIGAGERANMRGFVSNL